MDFLKFIFLDIQRSFKQLDSCLEKLEQNHIHSHLHQGNQDQNVSSFSNKSDMNKLLQEAVKKLDKIKVHYGYEGQLKEEEKPLQEEERQQNTSTSISMEQEIDPFYAEQH